MEAGERNGEAGAAREADTLGHLGHGSDLRVLLLMLRNEQNALLVADVDRQRDGHAGEDDGVFEGDE
jgi:hypothetical protein